MQGSLNRLIPIYLLLMWGVFYWLFSNGSISGFQMILLAVSHLLCSLVFINFVYVFNYSYALNVILLNLLIVAYLRPSLPVLLINLSIAIYGLRLFWFVHRRYAAASYSDNKRKAAEADQQLPLFVKILMWLFVSWLMFFHSFASYYIASIDSLSAWVWPAVAVMWLGLIIEAVADHQKQQAKQQQPQRYCDSGLFRYSRHPNYFGEILFVVGMYLAGAACFNAGFQFLAALLTPLWIVILMIWSAANSDQRQRERYGDNTEFKDYSNRVPVLWPGFKPSN